MREVRTHRPESTRTKMSITDRAKQFAPYAALGRLDSVLLEMERHVDNGDPEHVIDWSDLTQDDIAQMLAEKT